MAQDPYRYFRVEASELLGQISKGLFEIERGAADPSLLSSLMRATHTLKGAARVVKQARIGDLAHSIEDELSRARDKPIEAARVSELLRMVDEIEHLLRALGASKSDGPTPARQEDPQRIVRTEAAELEELLERIIEANVQLSAMRRELQALERARQLASLLSDQLSIVGPQALRDESNRLRDKAKSIAGDLSDTLLGVGRTLSFGIEQVDRELGQARASAEGLRLLPVHTLFGTLERAVRDAAQTLGKRARFVARGGDLGLDSQVIGLAQSALVQLVRNAVAHGIELPSERTAAGKPPEGTVTLEVTREGHRARFACRDDGRGIDVGGLLRAAREKNVLPSDAHERTPADLLKLLLRVGLSTSQTVTEVAGRGVGFDVVHKAVSQLGGELHVTTERGLGSSIELLVPISLASFEALLLSTAGVTTCLPLDAVKSTLRVLRSEIVRGADGSSLSFEGRTTTFRLLADLLGLPSANLAQAGAFSAVLVDGGTGLVALGVDRVLGVGNVTLRPPPELARAHAIVAGVTLNAEGNPELVLDPRELVARARSRPDAPHAKAAQRLPILVIDDSLTTRMLEQSILESAGYEVVLATSAEEGLARAEEREFALFLVDVEMPGMDGFSFVAHTRQQPRFAKTPAILVTSRSSPEDLERGKRAGASGYVVKGEFDQAALLGLIRSLAG